MDENRSLGRIPCGGTPAGAEEEEGGAAAAAAAAGNRTDDLIPGGREAAKRPQEDVKMGLVFGLLWLFTGFLQGAHGQGVYGKDVTDTQSVCCTFVHVKHDVSTILTACNPEHHPHQLDLVRDLARV